tara:strand:- start:1149 stop:1580 length:432 start_codon:yes stop_codon:yes gene_type:complete
MQDKIDINNITNAKRAKIKYGDGAVYFEGNGEVAAFEIKYTGNFKAVNCLSEGWDMKTGRNKIIIWSLAQTPISEKLFNYIGSLEITNAIFANWEGESYVAAVSSIDKSSWKKSDGNWNSDGRKPEEIENNKIIHRKIYKSKI